MGKSLIQQKRGKGGPRYRAPSFNYKGKIGYGSIENSLSNAKILELIHSAGHSAPLMEVEYNNGNSVLLPAPEGVREGDSIEVVNHTEEALSKPGTILPLKDIPEGASIYNIESNPGDGGKFVRCSGLSAKIVTKGEDGIVILLPSSKKKTFNPECRAILGTIGGSGRTEKPFLKAGTRYFAMTAKNKVRSE